MIMAFASNSVQRNRVKDANNKNDELDFYTNTLLENLKEIKNKPEYFYGFCEKCHIAVEGEDVGCKAFDNKVFHITCFTCEACAKPMHGLNFYSVNMNPYCEECYLNTLERCSSCHNLITDRILRAVGEKFHPDCFSCSICLTNLASVPFTVDDNNKIYCIEDYYKLYAPVCSVCNGRIIPDPGSEEALRVIVMGRDYHVNCFKCDLCNTLLQSGKGCYPLNNKLHCLNCYTIVMQRKSKVQ